MATSYQRLRKAYEGQTEKVERMAAFIVSGMRKAGKTDEEIVEALRAEFMEPQPLEAAFAKALASDGKPCAGSFRFKAAHEELAKSKNAKKQNPIQHSTSPWGEADS